MTIATFIATILCELLLGGSLVLTLISNKHRVWPPPGRNSWQFYFTWGLTVASAIGVAIVTVLDWNTFVLPNWLRFSVGLPLIVAGNAVCFWGIRTLSMHASLGLQAKVICQGPYRFTRNPQYVGDMALLLGIGLLSNSLLSLITCGLGMIWFFIAPFTEEPWLTEQYGEEYEEYRKQVRRFL